MRREFEDFLKCGRLEYGFLRVRCSDCHAEKWVAFSCKRRGFCPSCGARRMVESAALLADEVPARVPLLTTGVTDPRVAPFHVAKMTARLQAATTSGKSILLRVDYDAGHGFGFTRAQQDREAADAYAFLSWQLKGAA